MPKYHDNIHAKWVAIQHAPPGPLNSALRNAADLVDDLLDYTGAYLGPLYCSGGLH
jgi:hypothetical protein